MRAFSADSHPGHRRSHNEDCYQANPELGLWLVADGVGGHANGEVASAIVRNTLDRDLTEMVRDRQLTTIKGIGAALAPALTAPATGAGLGGGLAALLCAGALSGCELDEETLNGGGDGSMFYLRITASGAAARTAGSSDSSAIFIDAS